MIYDTIASLLKRKTSTPLISVAPTVTVADAVRAMSEAQVGAAVVLDQENLVGIFTKRDLMVRVVDGGRDPRSTLVSDVMTSPVSTVAPTTSIGDAMRLMLERRHCHLPVVEEGRVCGLISMGDATDSVIRALEEQVERHLLGNEDEYLRWWWASEDPGRQTNGVLQLPRLRRIGSDHVAPRRRSG